MIFVTAGASGVWVGTYDPTLPELIRWDPQPELGDLPLRPMSMAEINEGLYVSSSDSIYHRLDGPQPKWEKVYADKYVASAVLERNIGGIRGMTAVPSQVERDRDAILYFLDNRIVRVEPDDNFVGIMELDITKLFEDRTGLKTGFTLGAYNDMLAIPVPGDGEPQFLIGMQASIGTKAALLSERPSYGNYDGGGWVLIRNSPSQYELACVDDPPLTDEMPLVAVRSIVESPFDDERLYFAGFDCNFNMCHGTSWIYEGTIEALRATTKRSYLTQIYDANDPLNNEVLKQRAAQFIQYLDDDKDGKVTVDETRDGHPRSSSWKQWFRSMDIDKDGILSDGDLLVSIRS